MFVWYHVWIAFKGKKGFLSVTCDEYQLKSDKHETM